MKTSSNRTWATCAAVALLCASAGQVSAEQAQTRPDSGAPAPKMLTRPHLGDFSQPDVRPGASVPAIALEWSERGPRGSSERLAAALAVLLPEEQARRIAKEGMLERVAGGEAIGTWVPLEGTAVLARYQPEYDEIRFIHTELDAIDDPAPDLGEERISDLAESYLKRLGEAGAIDPRLYASAAMQLGYKRVGGGPLDAAPKPGRIVEYRITFRPRIAGFEMANAGVRLGILATGELASLRLGGVTPRVQWRDEVLQPGEGGGMRKVQVDTKDLMARFHAALPKDAQVQVAWSRIMYAMPDGKREAVVEPMLLVSYSELRKADGREVVSRRKTLGFSLTDPSAAVVDFDAPAAPHEQTATTRKGYGQAD